MTRLADMGVEPYLLASSLLGVLAQRLVRTLCPACRRAARAVRRRAQAACASSACRADSRCGPRRAATTCNHTGYRGRTGVYELLLVDDAIRRNIHDGAGELALRDAATHAGMRTLRRDGARWIADGTMSLAELLRVTRDA